MKLIRRKMKRGRVEIVPMIDTIIILLIFYMTFSRFAEVIRENVRLPKALAGVKVEPQENQVVVNMLAGGEVRIGGNDYRTTDLAQFFEGVRRHDTAKATPTVMLRGDKRMTFRNLSDFMNACAAAGVRDITFVTIEGTQ